MTATSNRSYPEDFGSTFGHYLDAVRCASRSSTDRRCQLHAHHDGDHAAAWQEPPRHSTAGTVNRPGPTHWARWPDDGTEREQTPGSERLRWCCMHRA